MKWIALVSLLSLVTTALYAGGFEREFFAKSTSGLRYGKEVKKCKLVIFDNDFDSTYIKIYIDDANSNHYYPLGKGRIKYQGLDFNFRPLREVVYQDDSLLPEYRFFAQYKEGHLFYESLFAPKLIEKKEVSIKLKVNPELDKPEYVVISVKRDYFDGKGPRFAHAYCTF